jgi:pilus assembly protein CpaF
MGVVERLARRVVTDQIALERDAVAAHVSRLLPVEAPLFDATEAVSVVDAVLGLGALERLLRDTTVSDVLVNGDGAVWVERNGSLQREDAVFSGPGELLAAIERTIAPLGLRLDPASPAVDARLPDGSRLHAIVPPASPDGPVLAIRRFSETVRNLDELVAAGAVDEEGALRLRELVENRANILVCGPTGAGKTTLLNILLHELAPGERVVTIEDAAELRPVGHVVRLEGRPANSEGSGGITQRQLLRHALRLRPDRIVVGEVRGAEAFDILQALSTGHDGSMSTIHARTPEEALWRMETLALLEAIATSESVHRQVRRAVDAVVVVGRRGGKRVVLSIVSVGRELEGVYSCP